MVWQERRYLDMDEFHDWLAERDKNRANQAEKRVVQLHENA